MRLRDAYSGPGPAGSQWSRDRARDPTSTTAWAWEKTMVLVHGHGAMELVNGTDRSRGACGPVWLSPDPRLRAVSAL
jgi:hypothetical protein